MHRLLKTKYLIRKVNIVPVKIDFPLPKAIEGADKRINTPNTYKLPEHLFQKHHPTHLVGSTLRLAHLMEKWEQYVDQVVTVVGWARETRMAAKDTILFVKLIDGSNNTPLQVVIEDKIANWDDFKKAKKDYSFKLTGKVEKSIGKGQTIELKLRG